MNLEHLEEVTSAQNKARGGSSSRQKTHCPEGHPYSGDNLMVSKGRRYCRTCRFAKQNRTRRAHIMRKHEAEDHPWAEKISPKGAIYCATCWSLKRQRS